MTPTDYRSLLTADEDLTVGQPVIVNWTASHRYYRVPATIKKINRQSVLVTISEEVDTLGMGRYLAGHTITVPRIRNHKQWSVYNCVEPVNA